MSKHKHPTAANAELYGPKIFLEKHAQVPMSKNASSIIGEKMSELPPAWKIETVPKLALFPAYANYYRRTYISAGMRRGAWQYMFGSIFRAMFGIYSPTKYWDPDRESDVVTLMRDDYLKMKRKRFYGIYFFEVMRGTTVSGKLWYHNQPRKLNEGRPRRFFITRGGVICCRINRMDGEAGGHVDIEFKPINYWAEKMPISIMSIPYVNFESLLKNHFLRRLPDDGCIYKIRARGNTKPEKEGTRKKL